MARDTLTLLRPKHLCSPLAKRIVINICKTEVITVPSICHCSSKYRLLATIINHQLQIAMPLDD